MLTETVSIVKLDNEAVLLDTQRKQTCSGCSMKTGCGQYLLNKDSDQELLSIPASHLECLIRDQSLKVGDQIQLSLEPSQLLQMTSWFYLLPLCSLLLCTMLASMLNMSEGVTTLAAFFGLGFGVLFARAKLKSGKVASAVLPKFNNIAD